MTGLTSAQAEQRRANGLSNAVTAKVELTYWQIILRHTVTFFNFVFVLLAVILAVCGSGLQNMTFLMVAFFNALIGCIQQIRAKRAVDKLRFLAAQQLPVYRDGQKKLLRHDLLVQDDVVEFAQGDQLCADGVVIDGCFQANEALITGEADPVNKRPGEAVLSGSFVLSGRGLVRLTRVGNDSFAARLSQEAKRNPRTAKSEMMASLDKLIRVLGISLIPVGLVLFYHEFYALGQSLQKSAEATVAAVVGMIPEGLYLLTSVALAVSALTLSRKQVLVQDMGCIETLARVDTLCVDKTGTITAPGMTLEQLLPLSGGEERIRSALSALFHSREPENDTAKALFDAFPQDPGWECTEWVPFSPNTKWCAATFQAQGSYIAGAPEMLLPPGDPLCDSVSAHQLAGYRVLLLGEYAGSLNAFDRRGVTPLALVLLKSILRPNAAKTFAYFAAQGVEIKVISGDSAATASAVAQQAGILGATRYIDASTLQTDADFHGAVQNYTVFGRVTPEQKKRLVQAMQACGRTVAMTGDGVNDILAMRQADCAIAMAGGAQAASQIAQLVLLNGDFGAMPAIVAEGRRVINNIQRAGALFLVKNILSFGLAMLNLLLGLSYPFAPIHLTVISVLTIGTPSFFLALEPNYSLVRGKFLPSVLRQALPGGLTNIATVVLAQLCAAAFSLPTTDIHTVCTGVLGIVGMAVLFRVCRPFAPFRKLLWSAMGVGLIGCFLVLGKPFGFVITTPVSFGILALMALVALGVFAAMQALFRRINSERR